MDSPLGSSVQTTPDPKRQKAGQQEMASKDFVFIGYPNAVSLPSKATLKDLLEKAVTDPKGDQSILQAAGILSLEQVLLPAIALHEEAALKRVQAKIQRDCPEHKSIVEAGRRLIRTSIRNAMVAVQASRHSRLEKQNVRRQEALEVLRNERTERQEERDRLRKAEIERQRDEARQAREQRFRILQRQYPRNKDLWKEIVVLTRSRTQLEKEERLWNEAKKQQQEYREKCVQQNMSHGVESDVGTVSSEDLKEIILLRERTEASVKDIVLASKRIQHGLGEVLTILKDSEKARQQLYKEYRRNHQFSGYQGVHNPKSLIRFLSQEE
jgi:hypothetical protein